MHPKVPLHVQQRCKEKEMEAQNPQQTDGIVKVEFPAEPFDRVGAHENSTDRDRNHEPVHLLARRSAECTYDDCN